MSITTLTLVANGIMYPEIIVRSVISLSANLIYSVKYLATISKTDFELQKLLSTTDILHDIIVIKSLIEEKENVRNNTVDVCIENIRETLSELESNISSITSKIENHNKLWFSYFRSYNITLEKEQIPFLIEKLKHRFDLLIKIKSTHPLLT